MSATAKFVRHLAKNTQVGRIVTITPDEIAFYGYDEIVREATAEGFIAFQFDGSPLELVRPATA